MKTRQGFVSNSSTTSFLIYGVEVDSDSVDALADTTGLEDFYGGDCGGDFIGRSWGEVGDDQTGGEFKAEVEAAVAKALPDAKCSTIKRAYRDG
jgi:hypothetical protein